MAPQTARRDGWDKAAVANMGRFKSSSHWMNVVKWIKVEQQLKHIGHAHFKSEAGSREEGLA